MKDEFKIQIPTTNGWADQKASTGDGPYLDDHYATREAAEAEITDIRSGIPDYDARVVPVSVPHECDFYDEAPGDLDEIKLKIIRPDTTGPTP